MDNASRDRKDRIKQAVQEKVATLMAMIDASVARNPQQLYDTERDIAAITDEIAGHVVEAVVDRSVRDETVEAEAKALMKQAPDRMKRRCTREVTIQPYRGSPFTIEADYFAKAGLSDRKAKKKGGSTRT
jgi:hypothetical protein